MIDITESQEVKIESVRLGTGYAYSSGGYGFSVKLQHYPSNGKSCEVVFGDMGPNKALTKNAPASCEDLQLTTTSQIGVSKRINQLTSCVICPFLKLTLRASFYGNENSLALCSLNSIWDGSFKGITKKTLMVFFLNIGPSTIHR